MVERMEADIPGQREAHAHASTSNGLTCKPIPWPVAGAVGMHEHRGHLEYELGNCEGYTWPKEQQPQAQQRADNAHSMQQGHPLLCASHGMLPQGISPSGYTYSKPHTPNMRSARSGDGSAAVTGGFLGSSSSRPVTSATGSRKHPPSAFTPGRPSSPHLQVGHGTNASTWHGAEGKEQRQSMPTCNEGWMKRHLDLITRESPTSPAICHG